MHGMRVVELLLDQVSETGLEERPFDALQYAWSSISEAY
jgi:hypothetical protein